MSDILERFGTTVLPTCETRTDLGYGGPLRTAYTELSSGGAFDSLGDAAAIRGAWAIALAGELVETTRSALQTALAALRARRGQRDRLYRRLADNEVQWATARLVDLKAPATPDNVLYQAVELHWLVGDPTWSGRHHGAGWTLDSGIFLDTGYGLDEGADRFTLTGGGSTVCAVTNGGNAPVAAVKLTITAGSSNITQMTVSGTGSQGKYNGTIAAGKSLVVDMGALSVVNDGAADYAHWTLTGSQTIDDWLRLLPGANNITIALVGGGAGSTALFEFSDGWE